MAKRGRPTKTPSADDRAKVKELLAEKSPISDLAKMFGYSEPTFRKYFRSEILSEKKPAKAVPTRKVTDAQREKVKRYVGCRMPLADIARAIGYERDEEFDDFKKDFADDIRIGAAVYRAKVLDKLDDQMTAGVTGATNKLEALTQITEAQDQPQANSPGYVGKKATAKAHAAAIAAGGGKFAPRTPPRLAAVGGQRVDGKPGK